MTVRDGGKVHDGGKGCCFHFCIAWVKGESPNKINMRMAVVLKMETIAYDGSLSAG